MQVGCFSVDHRQIVEGQAVATFEGLSLCLLNTSFCDVLTRHEYYFYNQWYMNIAQVLLKPSQVPRLFPRLQAMKSGLTCALVLQIDAITK